MSTTSGCEDRVTGAADCQRQVRVGDVVFTSYGYTQRMATRHEELTRLSATTWATTPSARCS